MFLPDEKFKSSPLSITRYIQGLQFFLFSNQKFTCIKLVKMIQCLTRGPFRFLGFHRGMLLAKSIDPLPASGVVTCARGGYISWRAVVIPRIQSPILEGSRRDYTTDDKQIVSRRNDGDVYIR